jgi:lipoprotein NlpD
MLLAWRLNWATVLLLTLAGCAADSPRPPVEERPAPPSRRLQRHVVSSGETLFSIAWSYGVDFRRLADTNGIAAPYLIRPGQALRLPSTSIGSAGSAGARPDAMAADGKAGAAGTDKPVSKPRAIAAHKSADTAGIDKAQPLSGRWRWPAKGTLGDGYRVHSPAHKGIDIRGELGEPVYAANDGKVVYAGSGLVGYGNLLIIKHSDRYLSAYAHNNRLMVGEGAQVKAGDQVAEIGDSGTDSAKLHFEIRCDGEPVDPLRLLPTR